LHSTDSKKDIMEEDGKPQPMAGFRVGTVTPTARDGRTLQSERRNKKTVDRESETKRKVVSPLPLVPMAGVEMDNNNTQMKMGKEETEKQFVYFPVEVEVDDLVDWKEAAREKGKNNNNFMSNNNNNNNNNQDNHKDTHKKGALVKVNNTEVALFKYGEEILATTNKCPHAGGPLYLGDIEVLPDKSLCVRCPWHKWAFCLAKTQDPSGRENFRRNLFSDERVLASHEVGDCVFPPGREDKKMKVFPAVLDKKRKQVKIGFESFNSFTLINETF